MKKTVCVLLIVLGAAGTGWLGPRDARAQTALERLESRLRQQLGSTAKPDGQASKSDVQAAPAVTPPLPQPPSTESQPAKAGNRGWLGMVADDENDRGRGVRVLEITPEGPAAKAGFRTQDLITAVANIRVRQMSDLADMLEMYKPGDAVTFEVQRDGKTQKIEATLGMRPGQGSQTPASPAAPPAINAPAAPALPTAPGVPALTPPKAEEPLLLPPQMSATLAPPKLPAAQPDDRGRVETLERRLQQLEQRVADLERELKQKRN